MAIELAAGAKGGATRRSSFAAQGERTGALSSISYRIEVGTDEALTNLLAVDGGRTGRGDTRVPFNAALEPGRTYYWRVKAFDGSITSEWSPVMSFRAPSARWPTTGEEVVLRRGALRAVSRADRVARRTPCANMAFLRDRTIEAGPAAAWTSAGIQRGGPDISIDFLTYRINGHVEGVDIGHDYDNYDNHLSLTWASGEVPHAEPGLSARAVSCQ